MILTKKQPQFEAYNALHNYDFICFSETISLDSTDLSLNGFNLYHSHRKRNSLDTQAVFIEFLEYVKSSQLYFWHKNL